MVESSRRIAVTTTPAVRTTQQLQDGATTDHGSDLYFRFLTTENGGDKSQGYRGLVTSNKQLGPFFETPCDNRNSIYL